MEKVKEPKDPWMKDGQPATNKALTWAFYVAAQIVGWAICLALIGIAFWLGYLFTEWAGENDFFYPIALILGFYVSYRSIEAVARTMKQMRSDLFGE